MTANRRITISRHTRRGRRNLHVFEYGVTAGLWIAQDPLSHDERQAARKDYWTRPPARRQLSAASTSPRLIDHKVIDFGENTHVSARLLGVVLDALHAAGRAEVDVDDIKAVESQLSWKVQQLAGLPDPDRRRAEELLHVIIQERCSSV